MIKRKCDTCGIAREAIESNEPACCSWYIESVVCGDKTINDCTEYIPEKEEENNEH